MNESEVIELITAFGSLRKEQGYQHALSNEGSARAREKEAVQVYQTILAALKAYAERVI